LPESTFAAFRVALEVNHETGFVDTLGGAARLRRWMVERVLTHCATDRQARRAAADPAAALRDRVGAGRSPHVPRRTDGGRSGRAARSGLIASPSTSFPRERGDPYAVSSMIWKAAVTFGAARRDPDRQGLWVPAFAGTTKDFDG
jgi:hypothetical protein